MSGGLITLGFLAPFLSNIFCNIPGGEGSCKLVLTFAIYVIIVTIWLFGSIFLLLTKKLYKNHSPETKEQRVGLSTPIVVGLIMITLVVVIVLGSSFIGYRLF